MSAKVRLLEIGQSLADPRKTHVKKSVAILLVRRLLAEYLAPGVIRMLAVQAPIQHPSRFVPAAKPYIPGKMPPREVPGVYFKPPQSDRWKLDHRMVVLD